jgi:hypothetical protein
MCIENKICEQVNNFNYLGYNLTYEEEIDIERKLEKIQQSINNNKPSTLRPHLSFLHALFSHKYHSLSLVPVYCSYKQLPRIQHLFFVVPSETMDRGFTIFHPAKIRKHTRLSTYKTLARPVLTYGSKAWTIRKKDEQRPIIAKMKFIRTAGYSLLDHMRNEHILDKMKVTPTEYVNKNGQTWLQHIKRMDAARIPKLMFRYAPTGRLKRRWLETITGQWA